MRKPVLLSKDELFYIQHILWHMTDFMAGDDRPDHGMGVLKKYRKIKPEEKTKLNILAGRLRRIHRKWNS
jgi:hypothetical protein